MVGWMPILGKHDVVEPLGETIDRRNNFVTARHRQTSPRAEVILNVDDDQDVALAHGNLLAHPGLSLLFRQTAVKLCGGVYQGLSNLHLVCCAWLERAQWRG
jgi:hypothetical protein